MNIAINNLTRATGMGEIPASVIVAACTPSEVAMLEAGDVQAAMDAKSLREMLSTDEAGTPSVPSPAETVSESVYADEAEE